METKAARNHLLNLFKDDLRRQRRVDDYYLPLFVWCQDLLLSHGRTLLIGINAPQGAGKTTLTRTLVELFTIAGKNAAAVSIDDFYLTRKDQVALAAKFPNNPYLQQRGYPGTHDVSLGEKVLHQIKNGGGDSLKIPGYDKSAYQGQGDRRPKNEWIELKLPLDIVFLEGWMLGFPPVEKIKDTALQHINECLRDYVRWTKFFDAFIFLEPAEARYVIDWRVEAEEKMKAQGRAGMTRSEVTAYVTNFLPAYGLYLPALKAHPPVTENFLHWVIDKDRLPTAER